MPRPPRSFSSHAARNYKEPKLVRFGRYGMSIGLVSLAMFIVYVLIWFGTSMFLRGSIQDWFDARKKEGYLVSYDAKKARIGGFPFRVTATLSNVSFSPVKNKKGKRPWSWATQRLEFSVIPLPWKMGTVHVDLSAQQTFKQAGKTFEGRAENFDLAFNWTSKGIPDHIDLEVQELLLEPSRGSQKIQVGMLRVETARKDEGLYDFDVLGEDLELPLGVRGIGRKISHVILRGAFSENFGKDGFDKEKLSQWRDMGGVMELSRLQLHYGPLVVQGNGTMALDEELQLVGSFSARIQGFFQAVDRLHHGGVIRGPDASMAKVVLGMLSKHPKNGGPATISLPLTVQEKAFFAGPVRLIDLPEIHW